MLHVCFTSLEEELQKGNRDGCKSPLETSVVADSDEGEETEEEEEEEEEDKAVSVGIPSRTSSFSCSSPGKRPPSGVFSRCASDLEISLESIRNQVSVRAARHTATPFGGTLANKVITYKAAEPAKKTTSSSPVSSTAFNTVSLSLPRMSSPMFAALQSVTLETLLQMFVSRESVDGGRCFKQTTFGRLPRCLCFHVQRTTYEGGAVGKRSDQVVLPQFLNMEMFSYTGQMLKERLLSGEFGDPSANQGESARRGPSACYYRLCSVIVHLGGVGGGGHYVTYRRVRVRDDQRDEGCRAAAGVEKWFMISDQQVEEVGIAQVLKCQVYAAFYEKCERYPI